MASWNDISTAAPDLAGRVRARFEATGLGFLATLRADGSPRISGIEPLFAGDHVWLGMMPGSRKAADVRRDPRIALHSASVDKQVAEGDAKLSGRALEVADDETFAWFVRTFKEATGYVPEGPFPLFRVDVTEVSFVRPAGDHLDIEWWREGDGAHRLDRY
jgi:hypothetical protein